MPKKVKYYRLDNIKKLKAPWNIICGEKANGKSYAVKEDSILRAWKNPETSKFILLRRYDMEVKQNAVNNYFMDPKPSKIMELTEGAADGVTAWQGKIYLTKFNQDKNTTVKIRQIGYYMALSAEQHYASGAYPDVDTVIFEEFVSRNGYLPNEPKKLQYLISTIARHRQITVYMIGNTITRLSPYFSEWQLVNVPKQKQGTIDIYHQKAGDDVIDIAVEFCGSSGYKNKMFFGNPAKTIVSGVWEVDTYPHLMGDLVKDYEHLYDIVIKCKNFTFLARLLLAIDTGLAIWYVSPKTTPIKKGTRVVTDTATINDSLSTVGFRPLAPEEAEIFTYFYRADGVCYSDNLTGTDFTQCLKILKNS